MKIIDIHSHMWNLKYLPIAGILVRHSNGIIGHKFARGLEWLLVSKTAESYGKKDASINRYSEQIYNIPVRKYLNKKDFEFEIKSVFNFTEEQAIDAIESKTLVGDIISDTELKEALVLFEAMEESAGNLKVGLSEAELIAQRTGILRRFLRWISKAASEIKNHLNWFVFMMHSERAIYAHISEVDEGKADKFVHHMMDVDLFFDNEERGIQYRCHFDFETEQIKNIQSLNKDFPNKLIGFVAFNPKRNNCQQIVEKAINEKGFKGVKFYPPLGYKPSGGGFLPQDDHTLISQRIDTLFDYCERDGIPVFAHCTSWGFQAWPKKNSGYCSSPVFWERRLQRNPKLILCLAHAGGVEGWFTENYTDDKIDPNHIIAGDIEDDSDMQKKHWNNSYASLVYKLCCKYENVYCDAAYLDEMINSDGTLEVQARKNFKERLLKVFKASPKFSERIIYGSDWHMLFREAKNEVYLSSYIEFFEDKEFDVYRDNFFYNNAVSYLNLR